MPAALGELALGELETIDAVALGGVVEIDFALVAGVAAGTGVASGEVGWWGPPAPYLRPGYRVPVRQVDAVAPGAVLELAGEIVAGAARGGATALGHPLGAGFVLIAGAASGDGRTDAQEIRVMLADFLAVVEIESDPVDDFILDLLDAA